MNRRVRTALWNVVLSRLFGQLSANSNGFIVQDYHVFIALWKQFFCLPMDEFPRVLSERRDTFRDFLEVAEWHRVFDLLEHAAGRMTAHDSAIWTREINAALEQEGAGYRMCGRFIVPLGHTLGSALIDDAIDLFTTYEWKSVHSALTSACCAWSILKASDPSASSKTSAVSDDAAGPTTGQADIDRGKTSAVEALPDAALCLFVAALQSAIDLTAPSDPPQKTELTFKLGATHLASAELALNKAEEVAKIPQLQWPDVLAKQLTCTAQTLVHAIRSKSEPMHGSAPRAGGAAFLQQEALLGFAVNTAVLVLDQCVKTGLLKPRERLAHRATIQDPWGERRVGS